MAKVKSHSKLVNIINERLNNATNRYGFNYYDVINAEQEFKKSYCGDCLMEVDNYAIRYGNNNKTYVLLFEDKSSNKHKSKALFQLEREHNNIDRILAKHHLNNNDVRVFEFYVHDWKKPKIEWVTKSVRDYYNMSRELDVLQDNKDLMCFDDFIGVSAIFQNDFVERIGKMRYKHGRELLKKFNDVYGVKK